MKFFDESGKLLSLSLLGCVILGLVGLGSLSGAWVVSVLGGEVSGVEMSFIIILDYYSIGFTSAVVWISGSVMMFSYEYMGGEGYKLRFYFLVVLFVISMFLLIISPSILSVLLGWDGLGVTSYLLVLYFQNKKAYGASMITIMTNRLGDVLLLGLIGWGLCAGGWGMGELSLSGGLMVGFLVLAAMTKSAQVPFSAWLPAAMAAPTPVSALVHSSTLVTAGVYLMIRFDKLFSVGEIVSWVGLMTLLLASASALLEMDMKKIVAFSTLSQLGFMVCSIGGGEVSVGYFHMLVHAYFKAMLFIGVGGLIHSSSDYQDLRLVGMGVGSQLIMVSGVFVTLISLSGLPFMSGFYSKDMVIEMMNMSVVGGLWFFFYFSVFLTGAYSARMILSGLSGWKGGSGGSIGGEGGGVSGALGLMWGLAVSGGSLSGWGMKMSGVVVMDWWLKNVVLFIIMGGALMGGWVSSKGGLGLVGGYLMMGLSCFSGSMFVQWAVVASKGVYVGCDGAVGSGMKDMARGFSGSDVGGVSTGFFKSLEISFLAGILCLVLIY